MKAGEIGRSIRVADRGTHNQSRYRRASGHDRRQNLLRGRTPPYAVRRGRVGSGKTLTARAIMRLLDGPLHIDPAARIMLDGRDLMTFDEAAMRCIRGAETGMIFLEPMSLLTPVYTVADQVAEPLVVHAGLSWRAAKARTEDLFHLAGIPAPARLMRQYPHEFSGGIQQRAMITMALAYEPKLLIADEPATALDVTIQAQILDVLRVMQRRVGMAIVLIIHDLGAVAEMATDIAVMYAGKIVEIEPATEVLTTPRHPYTAALPRRTSAGRACALQRCAARRAR
jgi:ABC-type dipeptide/oligopeptide/nickel transport system ATPase component